MLKIGTKNDEIIDAVRNAYGEDDPKEISSLQINNLLEEGMRHEAHSSKPFTSICEEINSSFSYPYWRGPMIGSIDNRQTIDISVSSAYTILLAKKLSWTNFPLDECQNHCTKLVTGKHKDLNWYFKQVVSRS